METTTRFEHDLLGRVEIAPGAMAERNFDGLEKHMRAESDGDIETTMATLSADPYWIDYGTGVKLYGYKAVRDRYAARFRERPGLTIEIEQTVVTDTVAVLKAMWRNPTCAPNDESARIPMLIWLEFEDGKLVGESAYSSRPAV